MLVSVARWAAVGLGCGLRAKHQQCGADLAGHQHRLAQEETAFTDAKPGSGCRNFAARFEVGDHHLVFRAILRLGKVKLVAFVAGGKPMAANAALDAINAIEKHRHFAVQQLGGRAAKLVKHRARIGAARAGCCFIHAGWCHAFLSPLVPGPKHDARPNVRAPLMFPKCSCDGIFPPLASGVCWVGEQDDITGGDGGVSGHRGGAG